MNEEFNLDQTTLVNAWQQQLPEHLGPGESAQVLADLGDPQGIRLHIEASGHQMYSFDFQCSYMDPREVRVDLVDVECDGLTVDEHTENIQEMTQDYVRHIHECAQALHRITNLS
ncbi:hypothetical protein [Paenibacillus segetis]|uniref:Uncharacterized protein n=1 Tax=Paenibacillus segetis TaxID=1325360 RepID=A0ABQ1YTI6_9BACL|nr:hypothetical protein [Paenibacillus segetis]GGH38271.1 hypothetical protein GCM10008013_46250 [Paenibacillus segetis]